jgi:hypothetical protein
MAGVVLVAAVAVVGTACGSDDDDGAVSAQSTETEEAVTSTADPAGALPESAFLGDYELTDDDHGAMITVTIDGDNRIVEANGLPNHETGDFPNDGNPNTISEQEFTATIPGEPTFSGAAEAIKEPGFTVAGVKFDPGTAERATCESGETSSIEAQQDLIDLGLDFNNAHVQPTGAYHYHGTSEALADAVDGDEDLVHVGFAYDGHLVYYSRSGAYAPSYQLSTEDRAGTNCAYTPAQGGEQVSFGPTPDGALTEDWVFAEGSGELDRCNGITIDGQYVYLMTEVYPYIGRCLNGEFDEAAGGPGAGGPPPGGAPPAG